MLDGSPYPSTHIQLSKTAHSAPNFSGAKHCNLWFEEWSPVKGIPPAGGDSRDRTGNLRLAKPALSQLSYIPGKLVGLSGIEPLTSRLSGARSNHLSYRPTMMMCITPLERAFQIS